MKASLSKQVELVTLINELCSKWHTPTSAWYDSEAKMYSNEFFQVLYNPKEDSWRGQQVDVKGRLYPFNHGKEYSTDQALRLVRGLLYKADHRGEQ